MKAMKVYVLTLSQDFPVWHHRKGEQTDFRTKFLTGQYSNEAGTLGIGVGEKRKLHTIRANYDLWRKRFEQIAAGEACLSIRQWTGKPYASKQVEIARLTREDGIGMQLLCFAGNFSKKDRELHRPIVGGTKEVDYTQLAMNDGLSLQDWEDWFTYGDYDLREPMVIIHFTKFRY